MNGNKSEVEIRVLDFASAQPKDYAEVFKGFDKYQKGIRMLVNNVGVIDRAKFLEIDPQYLQDLIKVNIYSQVFMTKYGLTKF